MITKKKYLFCLWKSYFETGFSLTNYLKYFIGFYALASRAVELTLIIGVLYAIASFFIGWLWFKFNFQEAQTEVSNRYNLFVKEMRTGKLKGYFYSEEDMRKDLSKSRKV